MMPAASFQIQGGARVILFFCDTCGAPAHFSEGCHLLAAIHTGDASKAGRWFCSYRDGKPACNAEKK